MTTADTPVSCREACKRAFSFKNGNGMPAIHLLRITDRLQDGQASLI